MPESIQKYFQSDEFQNNKGKALLPLGIDVKWKTIVQDLSIYPATLIGGSTGSGKSTFFHCAITSLLKSLGSDDLQFILIEPKRVEFSVYKNLPNLLFPVIVDSKEAQKALGWCISEIDRRSKRNDNEKVPRIVVVIDECSDLMAYNLEYFESAIRHICAEGKKTKVNIIVGTSRPSPTDVYTPRLVESFKNRIAFQTATENDSKVILGFSGAEKLLGNGDMLVINPEVEGLTRLQGFFVSEEEVEEAIKNTK